MNMYYRIFFILILSILLISGCLLPSLTRLSIVIIEHPKGGYNVNYLQCIFKGWLTSTSNFVTPITAYVEWWWENYYGSGDKIVASGSWIFTSKDPEYIITSLKAPSGYIFLNYYWVKIWWYDEDGKYNKVESSKAYCYSLSSEDLESNMKKIEESLNTYTLPIFPIINIEKEKPNN